MKSFHQSGMVIGILLVLTWGFLGILFVLDQVGREEFFRYGVKGSAIIVLFVGAWTIVSGLLPQKNIITPKAEQPDQLPK